MELMLTQHLKEIRAVGKTSEGEEIVYSFKRKGEGVNRDLVRDRVAKINGKLEVEFPRLKTLLQKRNSLEYQKRKAELLVERFKDYAEYTIYK